jgi:hypothetical protein
MRRVPSLGRLQALREPDRNGCNWYIDTYGGIRPMVAEVGSVVAAAKGRYNLFVATALP